MVSIEAIFPKEDKRYFIRVSEDLLVKDFLNHVRGIFMCPTLDIYFPGGGDFMDFGLTLKEIGVYNGMGVIIADGRF